MRTDWRVRAAVLLGSILAVAGCSTTQPDSVGTRDASLAFEARATVNLFDCYEIWAPDPITGIPVYQGFNECYLAHDSQTGVVRSENRPVPWNYSLTVSIIHRGSTTEEIVTSVAGMIGSSVQPSDGIEDFVSLTGYDPSDQPAPIKQPEERPGYGLVQFRNGRQVSRGSPIWLETNNFFLGEPNILLAPTTFDFGVNSGDTVIVRARKQNVALMPDFLPRTPDPLLQLSGTLSVGGILIAPSGTKISSTADGAGVSFSFTVQ
jgi:hypothetical protein